MSDSNLTAAKDARIAELERENAALSNHVDLLLKTQKTADEFAKFSPPPNDDLRRAAQAVIDRWDSPKWKWDSHTGEFINALRKALKAAPEPQGRKWTLLLTSGRTGIVSFHGDKFKGHPEYERVDVVELAPETRTSHQLSPSGLALELIRTGMTSEQYAAAVEAVNAGPSSETGASDGPV